MMTVPRTGAARYAPRSASNELLDSCGISHAPRPNLCAAIATTKKVATNAPTTSQIDGGCMSEKMAQHGNSATRPPPSQKLAGWFQMLPLARPTAV